jgi:hypothetical protein
MRKSFALAIASILMAEAAMAATVTTSIVSPSAIPGNSAGRAPTAAAIGAGVPANTMLHEFLVTTDADILQIDQVVITLGAGASLYNVAQASGGSNVEPPSALFEGLVPQLQGDTWISTPGATSIAGNDVDPFGTPNNSWFDTTADGAVANSMFARFGVVGGTTPTTFSGRVQVAGTAGPENFAFSFTMGVVPEPATFGMASMALLGLAAFRRRK